LTSAFAIVVRLSAPLGLRPQLLLLLAQLGRQLLAEVVGLEDGPQLDDPVRAGRVARDPLRPFECLLDRLHLPDPVAGEQLLRLGERPVDHLLLGAREVDARALRARMQPVACEHHARLHQLLVELHHVLEQLRAGHHPRLALLGRLDQHHHSHLVYLHLVVVAPGTSNEEPGNRHAA
jgi:hypothetical protein